MKQIYKGKLFNYSNKALPNSYTKFKDLLFNKDNKEIKEEKENEYYKEPINSFRKQSYKNLSKLEHNKTSKKTIKKLSKFNENTVSVKIIKQPNKSEQKNDVLSKNNFNIENKYNKKCSRNKKINISNKRLDTFNNISTDINTKIVSSINTQYDNSSNKRKNNNLKNLYFPINRNAINFIDRNKLKSTKTVNLRLFEKFEEEIGKVNNDNRKLRIQINNNLFLDSDGFLLLNSLKTLPEMKYENNIKKIIKKNNYNKCRNNINKESFHKIKKDNINTNKNNFKCKYSLKKLMELNPYHSVPKNVKYCNLVDIKKISEQLSYVSGITPTRAATSQRHFFKTDINFVNKKNCINSKIINSVTVTYDNNYSSRKGELVWRILKKLKKKTISSSFRQACIFQGYSELWKYYSMILEKLLVNYSAYKWFITKDKYMEKDVFTEFLQYIDINIKENKTFPDKVYLLFGINGKDKMNIKIFYFIMELISNSSKNIDKINFILEILEDNNKQDYINLVEMQEILKSIILHENYLKDYNHLHEIIKNEFNIDKIESDIYITKSEVFTFLLNNEFLKKLIILFKNQLKNSFYYYNEEIIGSFNSTIRNAKKFLNEQNEVNRLCKHEISNYEYILRSVQNKRKILEKNKLVINSFEDFE